MTAKETLEASKDVLASRGICRVSYDEPGRGCCLVGAQQRAETGQSWLNRVMEERSGPGPERHISGDIKRTPAWQYLLQAMWDEGLNQVRRDPEGWLTHEWDGNPEVVMNLYDAAIALAQKDEDRTAAVELLGQLDIQVEVEREAVPA